MDKNEFKTIRGRLHKTQREMAHLLGTSLKAVHSYEQGWRTIPIHVERQMFFLLSRMLEKKQKSKPCWEIKNCPPQTRKECPAWEFKTGNLCWFISGTICHGSVQKAWKDKMKICRSCQVFKALF